MIEPAVTSQSFAATVGKRINGNKTLVMTSPTWFQNAVNLFRDGERVSLVITNHKPKRSLAQNAYYWVYLDLIAKETGNEVERLHTLFKGMFLTKEIVEVFGHKVRLVGSTTNLSKADFTAYIMAVEDFTGILSPPTENYFASKKSA